MEQWDYHMDMVLALNIKNVLDYSKKPMNLCNFIDTAEAYGAGENEKLVGEAFEGMRDKVIIATKLHLIGESNDWAKYIEDHLDASLKNLKTDYVDIYYMHRIPDPKKISIEDMAKIFGNLI